MPIRYKVVKRKSRCSAIINGNSHYARRYLPGTTVMAQEGTLGILVFKNKSSAESFANHFNHDHWSGYYPKTMIVLEVETIGRGKNIGWVSGGFRTQDLDWYYGDNEFDMSHNLTPDHTMGYPGVRVLE